MRKTAVERVRLLCPSEGDAEIDEHEGDTTDRTPRVECSELHNGLQLELEQEKEIPAPVGIQVGT